jgi:Mn-containing catalase
MFFHMQQLINPIVPDEPDSAAANALQEGLGGQFGEMRTMMQFLFQSFNFRGDANPYRDLIQAIGVEEISHVELMATTISRLLDGAPGYHGNGTPGEGGSTPLETALSNGNIHHFLVAGQGALPVDSVGNPWSGSYVYNSGNLTLDLLYNLMLEATGRLQKCRIYEMTSNKTARATISYLIARDAAHEAAYAKALETLGVSWGKTLPIPKFDAGKYPEVKAHMEQGAHRTLHHWRLDGSTMSAIFQGASPLTDNGEGALMATDEPPKGTPIPFAPERPEEFAPGLPAELLELADQAAKLAKRPRGGRASGERNGAQKMSEPRELLLAQLADAYYAEKALEKVLPRLAREATDPDLASGFEAHLEETRTHAANLEQVFEVLGERVRAEPCPGIEGIREEHDKFVAEHEPSPEVLDLFLTGAGARTEHYEIAAYGELATMAEALTDAKVTRLLRANLRDEEKTLKKLETIAKRLAKANGKTSSSGRRTSSSSGGRAKRATRPGGGSRSKASG